jgi:hypothetical protein
LDNPALPQKMLVPRLAAVFRDAVSFSFSMCASVSARS